MRAMILAAGRGERIRPLTDHTPKPLLKAGGQALIEYHLYALASAGISHIVINHSWLGEQLRQYLGDGKKYGVNIQYSAEPGQALETAGGIVKALPKLGDGPFIVVNADIWTDYNFADLTGTLRADAHIVLVKNPVHNPEGDFTLAENNLVIDQPMYTFSGISVFRPEFFTMLKEEVSPLAPLLRQAMMKGRVTGECYMGQWWDVGTAERLTELDHYLNTQKKN